jgi:hypothetical protein
MDWFLDFFPIAAIDAIGNDTIRHKYDPERDGKPPDLSSSSLSRGELSPTR